MCQAAPPILPGHLGSRDKLRVTCAGWGPPWSPDREDTVPSAGPGTHPHWKEGPRSHSLALSYVRRGPLSPGPPMGTLFSPREFRNAQALETRHSIPFPQGAEFLRDKEAVSVGPKGAAVPLGSPAAPRADWAAGVLWEPGLAPGRYKGPPETGLPSRGQHLSRGPGGDRDAAHKRPGLGLARGVAPDAPAPVVTGSGSWWRRGPICSHLSARSVSRCVR